MWMHIAWFQGSVLRQKKIPETDIMYRTRRVTALWKLILMPSIQISNERPRGTGYQFLLQKILTSENRAFEG